jgi:hypothetical protein
VRTLIDGILGFPTSSTSGLATAVVTVAELENRWPGCTVLYVDPNSIRRLTTEQSKARHRRLGPKRSEVVWIVATAYLYSL